jgi:hypothetical protein
MIPRLVDTAIAIGQGLGLATAAGLLASGPLAAGATAASQGWLEDPLNFLHRGAVVALMWALVIVELAVDAVWPGAQAGGRLGRRVVAGGLAFEFGAGNALPWAGLAIGAALAALTGLAMRSIRAGAVKAGGDVRGTALVEDGAGLGASALALIPFIGYPLGVAAGAMFARVRRRDDRKYEGLRVLR